MKVEVFKEYIPDIPCWVEEEVTTEELLDLLNRCNIIRIK